MKEYDRLLQQATQEEERHRAVAKTIIPLMYAALRDEEPNMTPQDARERIEKDCVGFWSRRTILDALPDEAKDPIKQRAGRKSRQTAAETAAQKKLVAGAEGQTIVEEDDGMSQKNTGGGADPSMPSLHQVGEKPDVAVEASNITSQVGAGASVSPERFPPLAVVRLDVHELGNIIATILFEEGKDCFLLVNSVDVLGASRDRKELARFLKERK